MDQAIDRKHRTYSEIRHRRTHQPRHTYTFLRLLARARDRQKAPWWWAAGAQQAMMRARAHVPQEIQQALAMARMTALRKPDGGVRGIATGDAFRRLVARTLAKQWADVFDNATRPYQFALQARAGTDALAAHVRVAIAQRRDAVLVSLDGRSAYDCMSRLAFLSKLRDVAPELSSLSSACFMANHRSTAGGTTASASGKSSEQGDALAPRCMHWGSTSRDCRRGCRTLPRVQKPFSSSDSSPAAEQAAPQRGHSGGPDYLY